MGCRFSNRRGRVLGVATAIALVTTTAFAQAPPPGAKGTTVETKSFVPRGLTVNGMSVVGSAWQADNTPIPHAKVRLRNVASGKIDAATTADVEGSFKFEQVNTGSYLVELVSDNDKVLAVSHPFTVGAGETVATFVRLGTKVPWFDGFFGNAALAVAAGAAAAGLTAVAPEQVRPVSGRQ